MNRRNRPSSPEFQPSSGKGGPEKLVYFPEKGYKHCPNTTGHFFICTHNLSDISRLAHSQVRVRIDASVVLAPDLGWRVPYLVGACTASSSTAPIRRALRSNANFLVQVGGAVARSMRTRRLDIPSQRLDCPSLRAPKIVHRRSRTRRSVALSLKTGSFLILLVGNF